jgi:hypothetical protein
MNDDEDEGANVVSLADERDRRRELLTQQPSAMAQRRRFDPNECKHGHVSVTDPDDPKREVECTSCKAILDPHTVLYGYALKERQFFYSNAELLRERKKLIEEIEKLERKRNNLRAVVRRIEKKGPNE